MKIILLSGGSGRRLWPLSNDIRAKQFIRIFRTEDGCHESMLERVYRQIKAVLPDASIMITAEWSQESVIHNQLGKQVSLCLEPCRKDTFPAIALAAAKFFDEEKVDKEEIIIVCPVDAYVNEDYFSAFTDMENEIKKENTNLVLLGMVPTYPSEKYGYIIPENDKKSCKVLEFKEKPDVLTAKEYITKGALWNGGVFAFRLSYLLHKTREITGKTSYQELLDNYGLLEKISFDYAVSEKESSVRVIRFFGEWKDVGTWNTITEVMESSKIGNVLVDETCRNLHVLNELDLPILCMGLENVVVSASPQGILVADKDRSSHMKPYVDSIKQKIMFAEKSWGFYRVLDVSEESLTIKVTLKPGQRMNYHSHQFRDEVWTITAGSGYVIPDGKKSKVDPGDVIQLPAFCKHTIVSNTELELIEVQSGRDIRVEDKEIFEMP